MKKSYPEYAKAYKKANREHIKAYQKLYVEQNRDKIKAKRKDWLARNKESVKAKHKEWLQRNKERVSQYYKTHKERYNAHARKSRLRYRNCVERKQRRAVYNRKNKDRILYMARVWRNANAEKLRALYRKLYAKNPERFKEKANVRRARKRGAQIEPVTKAQLVAREQEFGGGCFYCSCRGRVGPLEHWDHGTPLARGGAHKIANLFPSCAPCNRSKGTQTVVEFLSRVER